MSDVTGATESIMGGLNEQEFLMYRNDRQIRNILSKQRSRKTKELPEPPVDTVAMNEADTNADTCCMVTNFIPLV